VSFLALRDLMQVIGYSSETAWIFPAVLDTAVAVSTMMLVALGDKPARRTRTATTPTSAQAPPVQRQSQHSMRSAKPHVRPVTSTSILAPTARHPQAQDPVSVQLDRAHTVQAAHTETTQSDADLASDLIASGVTMQSVDTVIAVLSSRRDGASINAAGKASAINYRTAQRIVEAPAHRQRQLVAVG
jgi:hypothetical protein